MVIFTHIILHTKIFKTTTYTLIKFSGTNDVLIIDILSDKEVK